MRIEIGRPARATAFVLIVMAAAFSTLPAKAQSGNCGSSIVLGFGDSIADIARRCGTTVGAIMEVNPLLPNPRFVFPGLKIQLPAPPPATIDYVFRRGDTLLSIARDYGITLGDIYRLNPDIDAAHLRPGDVIALPADARPSPPPPPAEETVRYRVRPGDTLRSIARAQDVALGDIYRLNPGIRDRTLRVGDIVILPAGEPLPPPPPPPPINTVNYTVRPGDTLYSIARANSMTVTQILDLNPGLDASRLRVGDVLRLHGGVVPPPPQPPVGVTASVAPTAGPAGTIVQVTASGFRASTTLRLMAGAKVATLQEFQQITTDARGNATASVRIPDWAAGPGTLVFAFETLDGRLRAVTDTFRVGAAAPPPPPPNDIVVLGTLTREGVECQAMRGDDGRLYTLAGRNLGDFFPGDRVKVEGKLAQVSTCQQGTTIAVTRIGPAR